MKNKLTNFKIDYFITKTSNLKSLTWDVGLFMPEVHRLCMSPNVIYQYSYNKGLN